MCVNILFIYFIIEERRVDIMVIGRDGTGSASSSSLSSEVEVVISKGGLAGTVESEGREGGEEKRREE